MSRQTIRSIMLMTVTICIASSVALADVYEDDIYYNPKKENKNTAAASSGASKSNYISNFQDQDVDAYNRRDQYYVTPVDTIGQYVANDEDFVYTQQIQKYYNPTIVVENSDLLDDVLNNSVGNVEVVYNINGVPTFAPVYTNFYYTYPYALWSWNWWGPSWSIGWTSPWWGPSWSWTWGPSWGWGSGWGPVPAPGRPHGWHYANHRPGGHRPGGPQPGWASNTRPGGRNPHSASTRPGGNYSHGGSVRPGVNASAPSGSTNANHATPTTRPTTRRSGTGYLGGSAVESSGSNASSTRPATGGYNNRGTATTGTSTTGTKSTCTPRINSNTKTRSTVTNTNRTTTTNKSTSTNSSSGSNSRRSYSTPSRSSGSTSGGFRSSGGGRSSGGYRGGGGGRGGHR